jgi:hypothetical protein
MLAILSAKHRKAVWLHCRSWHFLVSLAVLAAVAIIMASLKVDLQWYGISSVLNNHL